ncbi:MAG: hypothetical protein IT581_11155 [Verrucomicrobiales bacterium]|nr:hypothetical protein [Verrucomicrobiales bacterium]
MILAVPIVMLSPTNSPLIGTVPLMLSYILDYLDERRRMRAAEHRSNWFPKSGAAGRVEELNVERT